MRQITIGHTLYCKFRFKEVTVFFNISYLKTCRNDIKGQVSKSGLKCILVLNGLLLRFFFFLISLHYFSRDGLEDSYFSPFVLPYFCSSLVLDLSSLNLIVSVSPMIYNFLNLIIYLYPALIWFIRNNLHSYFLLNIYFFTWFSRLNSLLDFPPLHWGCSLVSLAILKVFLLLKLNRS